MHLSVIIPTYRRPDDLPRIFQSLLDQNLQPYEVIVIVGPDDDESLVVLRMWKIRYSTLKVVEATKPSVIHSLNLGLSIVKGDIICLLDDDVYLPKDWLKKIFWAFSNDYNLGAFGGRDHLQLDQEPLLANPPLSKVVGKFKWDGSLVGNHHCGSVKSPVQVDVLKGCNLSLRRSAFPNMEIDKQLESQGAETCWEIDLCQRIIQNGFHLMYDNNNSVLHYASKRQAFDNRSNLFLPVWSNRIFNEVLVTAKFRPIYEILFFCLRTFLLGSRFQPGLLWSILLFYKYRWKVLKLPWLHLRFIWFGLICGLKKRKKTSLFI